MSLTNQVTHSTSMRRNHNRWDKRPGMLRKNPLSGRKCQVWKRNMLLMGQIYSSKNSQFNILRERGKKVAGGLRELNFHLS